MYRNVCMFENIGYKQKHARATQWSTTTLTVQRTSIKLHTHASARSHSLIRNRKKREKKPRNSFSFSERLRALQRCAEWLSNVDSLFHRNTNAYDCCCCCRHRFVVGILAIINLRRHVHIAGECVLVRVLYMFYVLYVYCACQELRVFGSSTRTHTYYCVKMWWNFSLNNDVIMMNVLVQQTIDILFAYCRAKASHVRWEAAHTRQHVCVCVWVVYNWISSMCGKRIFSFHSAEMAFSYKRESKCVRFFFSLPSPLRTQTHKRRHANTIWINDDNNNNSNHDDRRRPTTIFVFDATHQNNNKRQVARSFQTLCVCDTRNNKHIYLYTPQQWYIYI